MSLDRIVSGRLLPQLDYFFERLVTERTAMRLDGVSVFNGKDKFLPGKIAMGLSYLLLRTPRRSPDFRRYLEGYRDIAAMTIEHDNESWGIYYYVAALNRLREAGLLERAIDAATLERLREKLDWRSFVNRKDLSLIELPTNYYGVAFSIARLRYLLGWDGASASKALLRCMVRHYETYSGQFGFSDETEGEGRFDRYSILLSGEICQRCIETGMPVTAQMKKWLRKAVDVILIRLNTQGDGFDFGRSIGAYGDTAFVEVLTTAATLGILTPDERDMAYSFAIKTANKYARFWYDKHTHAINLWDKGRRTDAYRGKHRILGESLSMLHQYAYTNEQWNRLGCGGQTASRKFTGWLKRLPRFTLTWFARDEYDRALLTVRDGSRIFSLPIVNGGMKQHMHNPYYPIPFCNAIVQGAADTDFPQLMPRFTLADGTQLIAAAFARGIRSTQRDETLSLRYRQDELDRLGEESPVKDARLRVETTYTFAPGLITRVDTYIPAQDLGNVTVDMEFACFADSTTRTGKHFVFDDAALEGFSATGFTNCSIDSVADNELYRAPMQQMKTRIRCTRSLRLDKPLRLGWMLRYKP